MMKPSFALLPILLLLSVGCDKRTPEEKGREYADEKLGFVEGATNELAERGQGIGEGIGKGLGSLVKGAGSAVKDVVHPPVKVQLAGALKSTGLEVGQATEGGAADETRKVIVHLSGKRSFQGELQLEALVGKKAVSRSLSSQKLDLQEGGTRVLKFEFAESVRFSKIESFRLQKRAEKELTLAEGIESAGLVLSQLSEEKGKEKNEVTVYVIFAKSFTNKLSLRALDESGAEVGRSEPQDALKKEADSSAYVTFQFDKRVPLHRTKSYELSLR